MCWKTACPQLEKTYNNVTGTLFYPANNRPETRPRSCARTRTSGDGATAYRRRLHVLGGQLPQPRAGAAGGRLHARPQRGVRPGVVLVGAGRGRDARAEVCGMRRASYFVLLL